MRVRKNKVLTLEDEQFANYLSNLWGKFDSQHSEIDKSEANATGAYAEIIWQYVRFHPNYKDCCLKVEELEKSTEVKRNDDVEDLREKIANEWGMSDFIDWKVKIPPENLSFSLVSVINMSRGTTLNERVQFAQKFIGYFHEILSHRSSGFLRLLKNIDLIKSDRLNCDPIIVAISPSLPLAETLESIKKIIISARNEANFNQLASVIDDATGLRLVPSFRDHLKNFVFFYFQDYSLETINNVNRKIFKVRVSNVSTSEIKSSIRQFEEKRKKAPFCFLLHPRKPKKLTKEEQERRLKEKKAKMKVNKNKSRKQASK